MAAAMARANGVAIVGVGLGLGSACATPAATNSCTSADGLQHVLHPAADVVPVV